jgi:prolyl-tRNA editing enzyme YbaK/EbsC (Cys-tRNA(Pro) deacylase)
MNDSILNQIRETLRARGIPFEERQHPPTTTSEESARARGEELGVGAKALLLRIDDSFRLLVLPADRKLDSKKVKQHFAAKSVRFATAEELLEQTGLVPGAVPPFGPPILPFELFADTEIGVRYCKVAFNAGSLTDSIVLQAADWLSVANPTRVAFSK